MALKLGQLTQSSSYDDVAQVIVAEAIARGYSRVDGIPCLSTGIQESSLNPRAVSSNGKWKNIYQQDTSYLGRDDVNSAIGEFFNRLDAKRNSPGASADNWLNIFWLQQAPGRRTAQEAYDRGRKEYLTEIKSRAGEATRLWDKYSNASLSEGEAKVGFTGDPTYLEEVLRKDLGDRLIVEKDWKERGTGGIMGDNWGVMIHHTGNANEKMQIIRDGVQQPSGFLPGPLSQALVYPDGRFHLIAIGPCNHAGGRDANGMGPDNANSRLIAFECAYNGSGGWPQKQIITMRDATAAILRFLGHKSDRCIGHKEYAPSRKPDPGNMDMKWFRGEVQLDIDGHVFPGEQLTSIPPAPTPGLWSAYSDRQLQEYIASQIGPGNPSWPATEYNKKGEPLTLRDTLAKYNGKDL